MGRPFLQPKAFFYMINDYVLLRDSWDSKAFDSELEVSEGYKDKLGLMLSSLKLKLDDFRRASTQTNLANPGGQFIPKIKLPQLELPTFGGRPETYDRFIYNLDKLLNKYELSQFEKFQYLLQQVSGPARQIVQSVPDCDMSYDTAKKLLQDAFSDKTLQQYSVIERFLKLKLVPTNMYSWISETRMLIEQMDRLEINGEKFAQYFLWSGMCNSLRQQFILTTKKSKPDLNEIVGCAFEVFDRVKQGALSLSETPQLVAEPIDVMATEVKYPQSNSQSKPSIDYKSCWLCQVSNIKNVNHKVIDCVEFPTVEEKLAIVEKFNGCKKCGLLNHNINKCRFKFTDRCSCGQMHAAFLCSSIKLDKKNYEITDNSLLI